MFDSNRIENAMQMNQSDLYAAAVAARDAGDSAQMGRASGCGRVYVFVGYKALRKNSKAAKTLQSAGFRLTPRPNDSGVLIYVGYDNASGREIGMGETIAQSFRESGIAAGMCADGD